VKQPTLIWKRYFYRVIGYALVGGGTGLVVDELINGPFHLSIADHETWGLVAIVLGAYFISKMPKGK